MVKWLRHRPFTAVTWVRVPYGSPKESSPQCGLLSFAGRDSNHVRSRRGRLHEPVRTPVNTVICAASRKAQMQASPVRVTKRKQSATRAVFFCCMGLESCPHMPAARFPCGARRLRMPPSGASASSPRPEGGESQGEERCFRSLREADTAILHSSRKIDNKTPPVARGSSPRMPCRLNSNLHTKAGGSPKFCFTASNVRPKPGGLQSADSSRHPL